LRDTRFEQHHLHVPATFQTANIDIPVETLAPNRRNTVAGHIIVRASIERSLTKIIGVKLFAAMLQ